jgi:hypothetical protein
MHDEFLKNTLKKNARANVWLGTFVALAAGVGLSTRFGWHILAAAAVVLPLLLSKVFYARREARCLTKEPFDSPDAGWLGDQLSDKRLLVFMGVGAVIGFGLSWLAAALGRGLRVLRESFPPISVFGVDLDSAAVAIVAAILFAVGSRVVIDAWSNRKVAQWRQIQSRLAA